MDYYLIARYCAVTCVAIVAILAGQYALAHGVDSGAVYLSSAALIALLTATFSPTKK